MAVMAIGYGALLSYLRIHLPPWLEQEAARLTHRQVILGEVQDLTLTRIRFGRSRLLPNARYPNHLDANTVDLQINYLPLLLQRTLPLTITLDGAEASFKQDVLGRWIHVVLAKVSLPIQFDLTLVVKQSRANFLPYGFKQPIDLKLNGQARYQEGDHPHWVYDLEVQRARSEINIKGKSELASGLNQIAIATQSFQLADWNLLLQNTPFRLDQGTVQTDTRWRLVPDQERHIHPQVKGNLNVQQAQARFAQHKIPFTAQAELKFEGDVVRFNQAKLGYGDITADLDGIYDWQTGFNLRGRIASLKLSSLRSLVPQLPTTTASNRLGAVFNLTGLIDNPRLIGSFQNQTPIVLNKTVFKSIIGQFDVNPQKLTLTRLQLSPRVGGQISAQGAILPLLQPSPTGHPQANWSKSQIQASWSARLPLMDLLKPYIQVPALLQIPLIIGQGKVKGDLRNPTGNLQWTSSGSTSASSNTTFSHTSGSAVLRNGRIRLQEGRLSSSQGQITAQGEANLGDRHWQSQFTLQSLAIQSLLAPNNSTFAALPFAQLAGTIRLKGQEWAIAPSNIQGDTDLDLYFNQDKVAIQSQFARGQGQANISFGTLSLAPWLTSVNLPLSLKHGDLSIQGNFAHPQTRSRFDWSQLTANGKVDLQVAQRSLHLTSTLREGNLQGTAQTAFLTLSPLLPPSAPSLNLIDTRLQFQQQLPSDLLAIKRTFLPQMNAQVQGQLAIGLNVLDIRSQLQQGNFNLQANSRQPLVGPVAASSLKIDRAQVQLAGYLPDLLTGQSPQFDRLRGRANVQLTTPQGQIALSTQLQRRQWQAQITANPFTLPQLRTPGKLAASLSGSLQSLSQQAAWLIRSDRIHLAFGQQTLTAKGDLQFSKPAGQVMLDRLNFAIAAQGNLGLLDFDPLLASLPLGSAWQPQALNLEGIGQFQGNISASAIPLSFLTPQQLQVQGKVNLSNFAVNDRAFERSLKGQVVLNPHQSFDFRLQGLQDVIALNLPLNTRTAFPLPYAFEIRQAAINPQPFVLKGETQGDRLSITATRFPLSLLKLAPLNSWDISTVLEGELSAAFTVNRSDLQSRGQFTLDRPTLGTVAATLLQGKVAYLNPVLSLEDALLRVGNGQYHLRGDLNWRSQAVSAQLRLDRAEIGDLIAVLQLQDFDRIRQFGQGKIPRSKAKTLAQDDLSDQGDSIAQRLQQLWRVDRGIQERAQQQRQGNLPRQLDLRGIISGGIDVTGTLQNPQVSWQLAGNRWQWIPQNPFPNIVDPLGLVLEASRPIYLGNWILAGQWSKEQLRFTPRWTLGASEMTGVGHLIYRDRQWQWLDSSLQVRKFNLDFLRNFVTLPLDIAGNLNIDTQFTGVWNNPKILGNFAFEEGALNGLLLKETLGGQFQYDRDRLSLNTNTSQFLQVNLDLPIPFPADTPAPFRIAAQIDTAEIPLLEQLTQNRLTWRGGTSQVKLDVAGTVSLGDRFQVNFAPLSQLVVTLTGAELGGTLLPMPLVLDGTILIKDQLIQPQNLVGHLGNSELLATGVLPFMPSDRAPTHPLTFTVQQAMIPQPQSLYSGNLSGKIVLTGSAFAPVIGGDLLFQGGNLRLPPPVAPTIPSRVSQVSASWFGDRRLTNGLFQPPQLQNFRIAMDNLAMVTSPEQSLDFSFDLTGKVLLNGSVGDLRRIQPEGTVYVTRGKINIPAVPLFLSRQYSNRLVFHPQEGLFDPYLDLKFKLYLFSVSLQTINANEILDDISRSGRASATEVTVNILGRAEQLLPSLTGNLETVCQLPTIDQPVIPENPQISPQTMTQLASCLRFGLIQGASFQELLRSPIVTFDSSPPLRENELQALLGNPQPTAIDQLQQQTSAQLREAGVPLVAVVVFPFLQDWVFELNEGATEWGKNIGLRTLRLYPTIETIVTLDNSSLLRFSYDYTVGEGTIRWESKF